ncbi:hypothetical protein MP478_09690 [Chryseobacterium sp. WG14]|uniref:hypothetical protein n=1 Tax=unclassified Chryseobacterium TaxID=2593645 RepID=UPI00211E4370|nr:MULTISPECIES: hypothetical protein [unclassified Chryseobacterium]MCQ9633407.1 hypothetical protein [Chryseobacterium sp. WG23]MCQ9639665.1 hypothetical protein [Chryseobacterium sp. WG14]
MKISSSVRIVSIISYLLIILAGEMIGLPFICWLLFTVFDVGNTDQIFAILGILGIVLNVTGWRNRIPVTILSFILMLSPLISRMIEVPLVKFNYLSFEIPLFTFIISYLIFIILNVQRQKFQTI